MGSLFMAFHLLTRIPVPHCPDLTDAKVARSMAFYPLVGLALGVLIVGIHAGTGFAFSEPVVSTLTVVALVILTGGIHLDGVADTCDALLSGRDREGMLEIMRDSRIGTFGTLGVMVVLLLKVALLSELRGEVLPVLPWALCSGRWCMVYAAFAHPYARDEGMGRVFATHVGWLEFLIASGTFVAVTAWVSTSLWPWLVFGVLLPSALVSWRLSTRLRGLTGDVYGFLDEAAEVWALFLFVLVHALA